MIKEFMPNPEEMGIKPEEMRSDWDRRSPALELAKERTLLELDSQFDRQTGNSKANLGPVGKTLETIGNYTVKGVIHTHLGVPPIPRPVEVLSKSFKELAGV